jgi:DNA-directed RNA polymerase subunit RPC12/RpoP
VGFKPSHPAPSAPVAGAVPPASEIPVDEEGRKQCPTCGVKVLAGNYPLHAVQCARNPAFHRVSCGFCGSTIFKKEVPRHHHCPDCSELMLMSEPGDENLWSIDEALAKHRATTCSNALLPCECGQSFPRSSLTAHRENDCPKATFPCRYCKVHFKKANLGPHEDKCGSRTGECEHCGKRVVMKLMQQHLDESCPILHPPPTPPPAPVVAAGEEGDRYLDAGDGGLGVVVDSAHHDGISRYLQQQPSAAGGSKAGAGFAASASAATAAALGAALGLGKSAGAKAIGAPVANSKVNALKTPSKAAPAAAPIINPDDRPADKERGPPRAAASDRDSRPVRNASQSDMSCPHCFSRCVDYEQLQMHVFTNCPKAAKALGLDVGGATATAVSPKATAAPSVSTGAGAGAGSDGPLSPLSSAVADMKAKKTTSTTSTTASSITGRPGSSSSGAARPPSAGSISGSGVPSSGLGLTRRPSFGSGGSGLGATGAAVIGSSSLSSRAPSSSLTGGSATGSATLGATGSRTVAVGGVKRAGPSVGGSAAAPTTSSSSSFRR